MLIIFLLCVVDCPQVQCVERYIACEHDELTLEESDIINVLKKMADGAYVYPYTVVDVHVSTLRRLCIFE